MSLRFRLIRLLAGSTPVLLNVRVVAPPRSRWTRLRRRWGLPERGPRMCLHLDRYADSAMIANCTFYSSRDVWKRATGIIESQPNERGGLW